MWWSAKGGSQFQKDWRKETQGGLKVGGGAVTLMCKRMSFEVENLGITWHFGFYVLTCTI